MSNLEKELDIEKQLKLAKIFKAVISAGLVAPVFVPASVCKGKASKVKKVKETVYE